MVHLVVPAVTVDIPDSAYEGRTDITRVTMPDSVRSIGGWAFSGCREITELQLPELLEVIGEHAFGGCSGITGLPPQLPPLHRRRWIL